MAKKKINAKRFVDTKLSTKVTLVFEEDGETQSDEFKLRYTAISPRRKRELDEWAADYDRDQADRAARREEALTKAQAEGADEARLEKIGAGFDEEERYALAEYLVFLGVELPEIVEGDAGEERPVEVTAELLAGFATKNLLAIRAAIHKDSNPNE